MRVDSCIIVRSLTHFARRRSRPDARHAREHQYLPPPLPSTPLPRASNFGAGAFLPRAISEADSVQRPSPRAGGPTHSCSSTLGVSFAPSSAWPGLAGAAAGLAEVTAADLLADHWFSNSLERTAPAAPTRSHPRRLQTRPQPQGRPPLFPKTRSAPGSWWLAVRKANAAIMVIRTHYSGRKGITGDRSPL